ncbi:MAG: hypothetical protein HY901_03945 [Deltaproteobacteria bacterium]|nr:hypothetical protein [Deltaproteobacteria bacterium]
MKTRMTLDSLFVAPSLRLLAALLLLPALGLGCGEGMLTPEEEAEATEDSIRIRPTDTENWANLTVQLPVGTCLPGGNCSRPLAVSPAIKIDGTAVNVGAAKRLPPGAHQVTVDNVLFAVTLTGGQSRTVTLPVAHSKCQAASLPNAMQTDFGATPTFRNAACPTTLASENLGFSDVILYQDDGACTSAVRGTWNPAVVAQLDCNSLNYQVWGVRIAGRCTDIGDVAGPDACRRAKTGDWSWAAAPTTSPAFSASDRAYAPGAYTYTIEGSAPVSITLNEGEQREIEIALPVIGTAGDLFRATINFREARELPDAVPATITSSVAGERAYSLPATAVATLNLQAYKNPSAVYTFSAGGRTVTLSQTSSNTISLNRIDVDDVTVTREDGTTYVTSGAYELYFGGNMIVGGTPTGTGIDVLPGDYELVLKYRTSDGDKTQRHTLHL